MPEGGLATVDGSVSIDGLASVDVASDTVGRPSSVVVMAALFVSFDVAPGTDIGGGGGMASSWSEESGDGVGTRRIVRFF